MMSNRNTKLTPPKMELYHWDEDERIFKPLSSNGGIPVYIVGGEGGLGGVDGKSAYELAVEQGFEGTIEEWLISLKGEKGDKGEQGQQGVAGNNGSDGFGTEVQYNDIIQRLENIESELEDLKGE